MEGSGLPRRAAGWFGRIPKAVLATVAAGVVLALLIAYLGGLGSDGESSLGPQFPEGGPVEFLYLDGTRVATYLAQVQGGKVESEKLTRKLTQNLNAKLEFEKLGEVGAAKVSELFAEKNVKPTAASSFFVLRQSLEDAGALIPIRPRYFENDVKPLEEGDFVSFQTDSLLPPIYVNAYLAVLHAGTLAAIFPNSPARRRESTNFFKKVGPTGRAVFALQPDAAAAKPGSARAAASRAAAGGREPFVYLLPFTVPLLSAERSLLKYGGGDFTVVGKLVRRFPRPTGGGFDSYVDSGTKETWEQALKLAPGELLCRTAPQCAEAIREGELDGAERDEVVEEARGRILAALEEQTTIPERGAVILPIAIYK